MATLAELRQKYDIPSGKNEPNPICMFCQGSGERTLKRSGKKMPCICLYVDHEISDWAGQSLSAVATKLLEELRPAQAATTV